MNKTDCLLVCLAKECVALAKEATKAPRFGLDGDHPFQLTQRTHADGLVTRFVFVIGLLKDEDALEWADDMGTPSDKKARWEDAVAYSKQKGRLS